MPRITPNRYEPSESKRQSKTHKTKKGSKKKNNSNARNQQQSCEEIELLEYNSRQKIKIQKLLETDMAYIMPNHYQLKIWRRDLKCLTRNHLPSFAKVLKMDEFDNSRLNPITGNVSSKRRANKNEILVEIANNKRTLLIKMGQFPILLVVSNICFYELNFSTFQKLFQHQKYSKKDLVMIFKSLKEGITDQLYQTFDLDDDETILWPAAIMEALNFQSNFVQQALQNFQVIQDDNIKLLDQVKSLIGKSNSNISMESQRNLQSQRSYVDRSGSQNHLLSSKNQKQKMEENEDNQDQMELQKPEPINNKPLKFEGLMMHSEEDRREGMSLEAEDIFEEEQQENLSHSQIINSIGASQLRCNFQSRLEEGSLNYKRIITEKTLCVWLIGTSNYLPINSGFIPWTCIPSQNLKQMLKKTLMSQILPSINQVISALNKFEELSFVHLRQQDWKLFLNRLSYYYPNFDSDKQRYKQRKDYQLNENYQLCLPLRFSNMKEDGKKILIRIFKNVESNNSDISPTELKWVPFDHVITNYQLPLLTKEELCLLYLVKKVPPMQIISKYFYRQFYFTPQSHQEKDSMTLNMKKVGQIFRTLYPQFYVSIDEVEMQRCIYCHYTIRQMEFECCFFCHRFCHAECINKISSKNQDSNDQKNKNFTTSEFLQIIGIAHHKNDPETMHENDNFTFLPKWICEKCQPCSICFEVVGINFLKCNICLNYLHLLCGKLKGLEQSSKILAEQYKKNYICESCLKCKMCNSKLKDQEYTLVGDDFFCSECSEKINKNQHCHICMKERDGSWILCDVLQCKKWIHDKCDPEYFQEFTRPPQDQNYFCPICRRKQIRNIYVELIRSISVFDQMQYFTEPSYQSIPLYKTIISSPMCFSKMKQKALMGYYDQLPFQQIRKQFNLIVSNAFQFNMPKDPPYYQAKILKILGELAFDYLKQFFTPSIKLLLDQQIWSEILKTRQNLHHHINDHYPEILINYGSAKSYIQVRRKTSALSINASLTPSLTTINKNPPLSTLIFKCPQQNLNPIPILEPVFHSSLIYSNLFKHSNVIFHLKKQKVKIDSLFTMPKSQVEVGSWLPIKGLVCYYHNDCDKIIYSCPQCFESYCCVTKCHRHHLCVNCGIKGCSCDHFECECTQYALKQKQKKVLINKLVTKYTYGNPNRNLREIYMDITENYKYCWKCARDNVNLRHCIYCDKLCSYNYRKCQNDICNKMWHIKCGDVISLISEYPLFCKYCLLELHSKENIMNTMEQCMILQTRSNIIKLSKIQKYMNVFLDIFMSLGVRLTPPEIQQLILNNYDQFSMRENLFKQYEMNLDLMRKYRAIRFSTSSTANSWNLSSQPEIGEEISKYLKLSAINEQLSLTHFPSNPRILDQYGGRLVYEGEYMFRCRSIWWKYMKWKFLFGMPKITRHFKLPDIMRDQKYRILTQVCSTWKASGKDRIGRFENCVFFSVPFPNSHFKRPITEEIKQFYEITPSRIRSQKMLRLSSQQTPTLYTYFEKIYTSPTQIIQALNQRQSDPQYHNNQHYRCHHPKNNQNYQFGTPIFHPKSVPLPPPYPSNNMNPKAIFNLNLNQDNKPLSNYQLQSQLDYRIPSYVNFSTIRESFFLSEFRTSSTILYKPRTIPHKYHYNPVLKRKGEINEKVSRFLEAIYQRSKCTLRKGNTSILKGNSSQIYNPNSVHSGGDKNHWVILKKWGKKSMNKNINQNNEQMKNKESKDVVACSLSTMEQILISLQKTANLWHLKIDTSSQIEMIEKKNYKNQFLVNEIEDIIQHLNEQLGCKLETFKDLGEFLGFTIYEPFYKANHFTHFLQTNLVDQMPYQTRVSHIKKLYDSYEWGQDGFIYKQSPIVQPAVSNNHNNSVSDINSSSFNKKQSFIRYEYNMTKTKPYYLYKRNQKKKDNDKSGRDGFVTKQTKQPQKSIPLVTFEDLKTHLQPSSILPVSLQKNQPPLNLKNISILNEVFIAPSKIHKLGLFSRKNIKKGSVVIQYMGQIISESVADLRQKQFHYGCYMFGIGKSHGNHFMEKKDIIDATFRGNMARYLNHSCDPNCKARTEAVNNLPRIFIYTVRDIQQYQELTYDYQFNVDADEKLECTCGAKNCQGRLN